MTSGRTSGLFAATSILDTEVVLYCMLAASTGDGGKIVGVYSRKRADFSKDTDNCIKFGSHIHSFPNRILSFKKFIKYGLPDNHNVGT